jgi:hypothetical protein
LGEVRPIPFLAWRSASFMNFSSLSFKSEPSPCLYVFFKDRGQFMNEL